MNIQASDSTPGRKHYHPIQTLLQKASTMTGSTEYLVHTLLGLACFIQLSSVSLNARLNFVSTVTRRVLLRCLFLPRRDSAAYAGTPAVTGQRVVFSRLCLGATIGCNQLPFALSGSIVHAGEGEQMRMSVARHGTKGEEACLHREPYLS